MILSLVHTPLPQPDFHNIRHHDAPGELCEYHDHLLRWHPGARLADDVATLHWHWYLLTSDRTDSRAGEPGAAFHAHVGDDIAATWDRLPQILPDDSCRLIVRDQAGPAGLSWLFPSAPNARLGGDGPHSAATICATAAPCAPLTTLLHRWNC